MEDERKGGGRVGEGWRMRGRVEKDEGKGKRRIREVEIGGR